MSDYALALTLVFVGITMLLSIRQKLGLEKEIVVGTVRSALQLLLVGYILHIVFGSRHPLLIMLIITVMIAVAAWNAGGRAKRVPRIRLAVALALLCTESVTMAVLLGLGIIEATPRFIIPVSGMTIGSSMVVSGLFLNQMKRETESSRGEMEAYLALGATVRQALAPSVKRAVRSSMIPTFDSMKTIGLVQLPGMMTGMIVAGAEPIEAVRYQILIVFVLASAAAITAMLMGYMSYRLWLDKEGRPYI
ncbi:iron export ABC transporter permease subunit FetB [Paenibacillus sambharensis]|uniref:Iron export ABC transporter permease subunit FetB n=1 Tax=Paenibacillus sambharensis TaxID=1803190 RepID=A0A2W1L6W5_9BACL|nr:iron export ABC transporter permease subunit FetB [Paenibacillus sambharensis]PZD94559.1 iron export ABC transporter permease subunit FetB [Paenibacillus sambharensis]